MTEKAICEMIPDGLLHSSPCLSLLDEIAYHLDSWEHLAPYIGISSEEQKEISKNYRGCYIIQKQKALRAWRRNLGEKATLESLIVILCREAQTVVAEWLKEIVGQRPMCIPIFGKYIREYYKFNPNVFTLEEKTLYRFDNSCSFIDLTLHEILADEGATSTTKSCSYRVVNLSDILNNQSERIAVLFEGVAGSGKTTLSLHICLEWAEGRLLQQFQLLIHVQLNDPKLKSVKYELADLIPDTEVEMRDEVATAIEDEKGRGICVLLDGLDEAPDEIWSSLLPELIAGKKYSSLSFILTARPGCHQLKPLKRKVASKIAVRGFDKKGIDKFINLDSNSNESAALTKAIVNNPRLTSLCSLPVNAATMKFLIHHFKNEIPETQTGISKVLLSHFIARHIQKNVDAPRSIYIENFDDDLQAYPDVKETFRKVCSLSYSALIERKRYFTIEDMKAAGFSESDMNEENKLGLLQTASITTEKFYCFPHLTFQEFLAAIHLTRLDYRTQVDEIAKLYKRNPLNPILPLYAGLTCLANKEVLNLLSSALETSLDDASVAISILHNPSRVGDPRQKALAFFNCLYECHNDKLMVPQNIQLKPNILLGNNLYQIAMSHFSMTPGDCLALGYFARYAVSNLKAGCFLHIQLGKCSDVGISSFLTEVTKVMDRDNHKKRLNVHPVCRKGIGLFLFDYVPRDDSSPLALKQFLQSQGSPYFKILQLVVGSGVSKKVIRVFLKCITEGIAATTTCTSIALFFPGLSQTYIHYLLLILSPLNTVNMFHLWGINLQNGVHLIRESLKYTRVQQLSLELCNIDDRGLEILGEGISRNSFLTKFAVKSNPYTVPGVIGFLKCLISKEAALMQLEIDDKVYAALPSEEEYHRVILHIIALRLTLGKPQLFINPATMEDSDQKNLFQYAYQSALLFTLPSKFSRRDSES